ncbi:MAG: choice-of-anchor F family protein [Desulfuromonadaceae bacterium]|nr:choice-of-anchor F family protein [Desulfuromonadaceae bacterium]MDD2849121.1 choice-of-anchor F family protein [Desulfuromonadaceae bacterium]MDD4129489.1 choice-of-anchor F family protein [Desulfuromonadaceae bacterium]
MMKRMRKTRVTLALAAIIATAGLSQAAQITSWDMSKVTYGVPTSITNPELVFDPFNYVVPGSLVDPNTGAVATGGFMPSGWSKYAGGYNLIPNGAMTWKERDTQGPGLSIVNIDDVTGENCVMSAGWNPDSTPTATQMSDWWGVDKKQCSDPFQSSKRFKVVTKVLDAPVDLTFNVLDDAKETQYRILQKLGNQTGNRVTGYTTQLGFVDANGTFTEAAPGQGVSFSLRNGTKFSNTNPTSSTMANQGELDSLVAHGLFGAPDKHHPAPGYFNPYVRANFGLLAGETHMSTTGMAQVHRDLFGEWMPSNHLKGGYYFDMDLISYTDNALMANCDGVFDEAAALAGAANAGCTGTWVTYRESLTPTLNPDGTWAIPAPVGTDIRQPVPVDAATLAMWKADPARWIPGDIDDFANVNINEFIVISNVSNWPTYDGKGNAKFTIRTTATFDDAVAQAEPGTATAADFLVAITAPTTVLP